MTEPFEEIKVEWLMLADGAQVVGGKLFVLGGGWDTVTVPQLPFTQQMAVALAVRVPWNSTNISHEFEVRITSEQTGRELVKVNGGFEVGRRPGIRQGQSQLMQLAAAIALRLDATGDYAVEALINGDLGRRTSFYVNQPGPARA